LALVHGVSGLWHDAHAVPKWFAGGVWHDAHADELGCDAAQLTPGFLWQVVHETDVGCPDGGLWHEAHADELCE
jgi:hypothetical protein